MVKLLLFIGSLLVAGFLALSVGWPWLIAVVAAEIIVGGYLLLKDFPNNPRFITLSTLFAIQALALAWGFIWTMQQVDTEALSSQLSVTIFQWMAGTVWLQNFWGIVGGIAGAIILFGMLIAAVNLFGLLPSAQSTGVSRVDNFTRGVRRSLGLIPAQWAVRNGEIVVVKAAKESYPPLTGPGEIEVQRDNAVILESNGGISRILLEGVHWVGYMERIYMPVPLFGRGEAVVVRNVSTNDPMMIEELNLAVFHKVNWPRLEKVSAEELKKNLETLLKDKVWAPSGNHWSAAVRAITEREARNVVADDDLETFLTLNETEREQFKKKLGDRVNKVTEEFLGVKVTITGIGAVTIPDLAAQKLTQRWLAARDGDIAREQTDLQRDIDSNLAQGRSDVMRILSDAMREAGSYHTKPNDFMLLSMIEQIQRSGNNPANATSQEMDMITRLLMMELLKTMSNSAATPADTV